MLAPITNSAPQPEHSAILPFSPWSFQPQCGQEMIGICFSTREVCHSIIANDEENNPDPIQLGSARAGVHSPLRPEVEQLIMQLRDKDEAVRLKAAKELGRLKDKGERRSTGAHPVATDDPDEDVREVAKKVTSQ